MTTVTTDNAAADFEARRAAHVQQAAVTAAAALRDFAQDVRAQLLESDLAVPGWASDDYRHGAHSILNQIDEAAARHADARPTQLPGLAELRARRELAHLCVGGAEVQDLIDDATRLAAAQVPHGLVAVICRVSASGRMTTEDLAAIGREGIDLTPLRGTITMPDDKDDLLEAYAYTVWACPECGDVHESDAEPDPTETCGCGQEVRVR